ncbi:hypothetical protein CRM22_004788 [Opisthorchis felineus]|uniref:Uncharacterized protein n=1 Tax=Opisthorchis felineus TaxID=147828 RepID=A0A4S2LUF3_OPIFE|nr:hypothetical protein CRM22_004788 [Opisthorchis felineus]
MAQDPVVQLATGHQTCTNHDQVHSATRMMKRADSKLLPVTVVAIHLPVNDPDIFEDTNLSRREVITEFYHVDTTGIAFVYHGYSESW